LVSDTVLVIPACFTHRKTVVSPIFNVLATAPDDKPLE